MTTQYPLEKVYVEYKPRDLSFQINPEVDENNLLEAPTCTAQSYPESKISYQVRSFLFEISPIRELDFSKSGFLIGRFPF